MYLPPFMTFAIWTGIVFWAVVVLAVCVWIGWSAGNLVLGMLS
jgi:hypothetical protein